MNEDVEDAIEAAKAEAERNFTDGEFTITATLWCDGDYEVTARSGVSQTEGENSVAEQFVLTPHGTRYEVIETTQSETFNVLVSRDADGGLP